MFRAALTSLGTVTLPSFRKYAVNSITLSFDKDLLLLPKTLFHVLCQPTFLLRQPLSFLNEFRRFLLTIRKLSELKSDLEYKQTQSGLLFSAH